MSNFLPHLRKNGRLLMASAGAALVLLVIYLPFRHSEEISYNRDIRPIFNAKCITCHGGVKKQGGFSLLFREEALGKTESGEPAIIPGDADGSELVKRLTHTDPQERMPLDAAPLSAEEIDKIRRWIDQGAQWEDHWAFVKPAPTPLPTVSDPTWPLNGIDHFILNKLEEEKLQPSPEADRITLIRRVSLDLTGLPPTPSEVQAFLRDSSARAYEKLVDRLLASPHYGERWAAPWLDLARYADSKGYEKDQYRNIWRYRDYVIKAFNEDKPFNQFTIEQLAGDLLPHPTDDQLLATAFHRNTTNNDEGGTDDEEFRTAAILDRVNTTWEVWQGTTMACVQCHSHPYDPFRHEDYYRALAFFNNTRDEDVPGEFPTFNAYTPVDSAKVQNLLQWVRTHAPVKEADTRIRSLEATLKVTPPLIHTHFSDQLTRASLVDDEKALAGHHNGSGRIRKNFNLTGKTLALIQYTTDQSGGTVEIHLDQPAGALLGTLMMKNVGRWGRAIEAVRLAPATGLHDLYLVFKGPRSKDLVGKVEWLAFTEHLPGSGQPGFAAVQSQFVELLNLSSDRTPILAENPAHMRRPTYVFTRGNWLLKGKPVQPNVPASMPSLPKEAPANRLGLAQWLVNPENPLTARVTVNRFWEQLFGTGLVETLEDFGSQGAKPSHPELLDWLAQQLVHEHHWSVKRLLKQLVLSATYRQSSKVSPDRLKRDPFNRLLARGPRVRLSAEQIRDQALAVSGLLSKKMFGPSVMPPQPAGVWQVVYSGNPWKTSAGKDAYRRALYTYWRRSSPYPSMVSFDSPVREICVSRRIRTNTPLQALVTLNDTVYIEAARALARRMVREGGPALDAQLRTGYQLAMGKAPQPGTLRVLQQLYRNAQQHYQERPTEAAEMLADSAALANRRPAKRRREVPVVPVGRMNLSTTQTQLASLTVVANAIMNLDEFITKE